MVASMKSSIPVINAGDGGHQHPTQTLTDLLYHPFPEGTPWKHHHWPMRRPEVRPHGTLSHPRPGPLRKCKICPNLPEELKVPDYIREDVLEKMAMLTRRWSDWRKSCLNWICST